MSFLVPGSISGIILVSVVPGTIWYHEGTSIFCLALRSSCSRILARTGESSHYSGSNASRSYSSRTLRAVALCVFTLPPSRKPTTVAPDVIDNTSSATRFFCTPVRHLCRKSIICRTRDVIRCYGTCLDVRGRLFVTIVALTIRTKKNGKKVLHIFFGHSGRRGG